MSCQMHLVIIQHAWAARAAWLWQLPSLVSCAHTSLTWCITWIWWEIAFEIYMKKSDRIASQKLSKSVNVQCMLKLQQAKVSAIFETRRIIFDVNNGKGQNLTTHWIAYWKLNIICGYLYLSKSRQLFLFYNSVKILVAKTCNQVFIVDRLLLAWTATMISKM